MCGALSFGIKYTNDIPTPAVYFVNKVHGVVSERQDISTSIVMSTPVGPLTHVRKMPDPRSPWTFEIDIDKFCDLSATLTGTIDVACNPCLFRGVCIGQIGIDVDEVVSGIPIPEGINTEASPTELDQISPMESVETTENGVKKRIDEDQAQKKADEIMQNVRAKSTKADLIAHASCAGPRWSKDYRRPTSRPRS